MERILTAVFLICSGAFIGVLSDQDRHNYYNGHELYCDFETSDCGLYNDPVMETQFQRYYEEIDGQMTYYMGVDVRRAGSSSARLITPYFRRRPNASPHGCLRANVYTLGDGIRGYRVAQQNHYNIVLLDATISDANPTWRQLEVEADLSQGDIRFFIDVLLGVEQDEGVLAITALQFKGGKC